MFGPNLSKVRIWYLVRIVASPKFIPKSQTQCWIWTQNCKNFPMYLNRAPYEDRESFRAIVDMSQASNPMFPEYIRDHNLTLEVLHN